MTNSYSGSELPKYFKTLFSFLEITPEFNNEALQTLQQKEIELGIKMPKALKECFCYFDKRVITEDPSIFYSYDDHHPTSSSIIRRMRALYGMDWDFRHYIEKDAKKEKEDEEIESILKFWGDSAGTCSFFIGLNGSENPPIFSYGIEYGIEDDYETLVRVSNHFSEFIIMMFLILVSFRHNVICSTNEPFTQNQLDSLKPLFPSYICRELADFKNFKYSSGFHTPSHEFLMYSDSQVLSMKKRKSQDDFVYTWKFNAKTEVLLTDLVDKVIKICPNLASCMKK